LACPNSWELTYPKKTQTNLLFKKDIEIFSAILGHKIANAHETTNKGKWYFGHIYRRQIDNGTVMLIRKGTASGETLCYQNKDPAFNSDMGL
jgi:hypothetical protein